MAEPQREVEDAATALGEIELREESYGDRSPSRIEVRDGSEAGPTDYGEEGSESTSPNGLARRDKPASSQRVVSTRPVFKIASLGVGGLALCVPHERSLGEPAACELAATFVGLNVFDSFPGLYLENVTARTLRWCFRKLHWVYAALLGRLIDLLCSFKAPAILLC